jgi:hypothetical protein
MNNSVSKSEREGSVGRRGDEGELEREGQMRADES